MKSEPNVFSIDDLKRDKTTCWEGVRNYQARNTLRDQMKIGDRAFFYHSNANPSGIAGVMEVIKEGYPDPTQFDSKSEYYDPKSSKENPRWYRVDVRFVQKCRELISLQELRKIPQLKKMILLNHGRLSVQPVTAKEWETILELSYW